MILSTFSKGKMPCTKKKPQSAKVGKEVNKF
jgi:hypothetical protein